MRLDQDEEEDDNETIETDRYTPEDLISEVLASAEQHSAATQNFIESYKFYDKTLQEWGIDLSIRIPKDPSPDDLRSIYIELLRKLQTAHVLYSRANSMLTALTEGSQVKKADITTALVKRYETNKARRPASSVISQMADTCLDIGYMKTASKIAKDFFKDQKDTLIEIRKTLEQLGFLMHLELKLRE
jgi:hypothetical protein